MHTHKHTRMHTDVFNQPSDVCPPQIVGDAVGWGFVVRGSKPCHIQAVDPGGPAAAAGMKVKKKRRRLWGEVVKEGQEGKLRKKRR